MGRAKDFIMGLPEARCRLRLEQMGFEITGVRHRDIRHRDIRQSAAYWFRREVSADRLSIRGAFIFPYSETVLNYYTLSVDKIGSTERSVLEHSADPEWLLQLLDYLAKVVVPKGKSNHWTLNGLAYKWVAANPNPKPRLF